MEDVETISDTTSIEVFDKEQVNIFFDIANFIKIEHYKQFRDLCSAISRLGSENLGKFYQILYDKNESNFSKTTAKALKKNLSYINSFLREHNRVPLQYILDVAVQQNFPFDRYKTTKRKTMFNIDKQLDAVVEYMNQRFALFSFGKSILTKIRGKNIRSFVKDNVTNIDTNKIQLLKVTDLRNYMRNKNLRVMNSKGIMELKPYVDVWLASSKRHDVQTIVCSSRKIRDKRIYNIWTGYNVFEHKVDSIIKKNTLEDLTENLKFILEWIFKVVANSDKFVYNFVLKWVADLIQNPTTNKPGKVLAIIGGQGEGKGTFGTMLQELIGATHTVKLNDSKNLSGFNKVLEGKLLVILDEAFYSGDKKFAQQFKSIITETELVVEPKFVDAYQTDNIARFLILSNNEQVVHLDKDDRRFLITKMSPLKKNDRKFYEQLRNEIAEKKHELFAFFKMLPIDYNSDFLFFKRTKEMVEHIQNSYDSFDLFVSFLVNNLTYEYNDKSISISLQQRTLVKMADLYMAYLNFATRVVKNKYPTRQPSFKKRFLALGAETQASQGNPPKAMISLPSVKELIQRNPDYAPDTKDFEMLMLADMDEFLV